MAVEKLDNPEVRAYLEYFRDMGVYDFYRNGEPVAMDQTAAEQGAAVPLSTERTTARSEAAVPVGSAATVAVEPAVPPVVLEAGSLIPKLISFNALGPLPESRVAREDRAAALEQIRHFIGDCTRCPLAYAGRRHVVFGDGDPNARLMFVGEGPGADEDALGLPFVGKSGQLLNNMIGAMGLKREQVYIANVVKCRPPANRAPEPVEANTCTQFLVRQMDVVQPAFVVALGATAAMYLLGVRQSLASLRGRFHEVRGAKAVVTFHPAFLLRDPRQKGEAWKDLQMVMGAMGLKPGSRE
jgi:DNA polymerase